DGIRDLTVTGVETCALPICELLHDADADSRHHVELRDSSRHTPSRTALAHVPPRWRAAAGPLRSDARRNGRDDAGQQVLAGPARSEERRVGKECRTGGGAAA